MMRARDLLLGLALWAVAGPAAAMPMVVAEQRFNGDGSGVAYTVTGGGVASPDDFWGLASTGGALGFAGQEGADFFAGRDLNEDLDGNGDVDPRVIELDPVDISSFSSASVALLLAAFTGEWESGDSDYIRIFAVDDATDVATLLDEFLPNGAGTADLQSSVFGTTLGTTFQAFAYTLPDVDDVRIRIEAHSTGDLESIGIDWVRIRRGPEPSTALLLGFGLALLAGRRHRHGLRS